jgi:hypothetical protein
MIDGEGKAPAGEILDHPKATLGAINRQTRFGQHQGFGFMNAFGCIAAVPFNPLEIFAAVNPISQAAWTLLRRKIWFKFVGNEFR